MTDPTPPQVPRDPVWLLLNEIRTCTATQLGYVRRPVVSFPIVFGDRPPAADYCACKGPNGATGSAWARVVPQRLANQDPRLAGTGCELGRWLHDLEVGVYRCWPTTSNASTGAAPTEKQLTDAADGVYKDASALRRVPRCCPWLTDKDISPVTATITALGPSGGCIAVILTATIQLDECVCPTGPLPPPLGGRR